MTKLNLCDVFGQNAKYVILKRKGRVQIFEELSDKTLRVKVKKGWSLVGWVNKEEDDSALLKIFMCHYGMVQTGD